MIDKKLLSKLIVSELKLFEEGLEGIQRTFPNIDSFGRTPARSPYVRRFYLNVLLRQANESNLDVIKYSARFEELSKRFDSMKQKFRDEYLQIVLMELRRLVAHWKNFVRNGLFSRDESSSFENELYIRDGIAILLEEFGKTNNLQDLIQEIQEADRKAKKQAMEQMENYKEHFPTAFDTFFNYPKRFWWRHWDDLD